MGESSVFNIILLKEANKIEKPICEDNNYLRTHLGWFEEVGPAALSSLQQQPT